MTYRELAAQIGKMTEVDKDCEVLTYDFDNKKVSEVYFDAKRLLLGDGPERQIFLMPVPRLND